MLNLLCAMISSTDDTLAILKRFQSDAPFAVKIVQNSQRLGSTRNFDQAIGLAARRFHRLCDQDDRWAPDKLERLSGCLTEDPFLGGVFSDANLIDGDGRQMRMRLFARHKFTPAKQREFIDCPTATLLKHDVVTGATLMFRSSIRRYCSPIPASWVHDGWLAWMIALHSRLDLDYRATHRLPDSYRPATGRECGASARKLDSKPETRRQFYSRVARQFEDLLQRVLLPRAGVRTMRWSGSIREKIAFLKTTVDPVAQPWCSEHSDDRSVAAVHAVRSGTRFVRTDLLLGAGVS